MVKTMGMKNVTEYLDASARKNPNKTAFVDNDNQISFYDLQIMAKRIAGKIIKMGHFRKPIVVYMGREIECLVSFMAILYSGNFYCPIDPEMPIERVKKIVSILKPTMVIENGKTINRKIINKIDVLEYKEDYDDDAERLIDDVRRRITIEDLAYVLFTSGSTGIPKGVAVSHRAIINSTEWMSEAYNVDSTWIFGNQGAFHFDLSVPDIYQTLKNASTTYIIPRIYFSYPIKMMQYLEDKEINSLVWVPSALCIIADSGVLEKRICHTLKHIMFCGEVMPIRQLNAWKRAYSEAVFVNFYGPTEATFACSGYVIDRDFEDDETLPLGEPGSNIELLILNSENMEVEKGEIGEICIRGSNLASGYYNDKEKTNEVFVQNPLNKIYPDIIYKTGDLAHINKKGEIIYDGRKDSQIKHYGHRIELGEIENIVLSMSNICQCACVYDSDKSRIVLFYNGEVENERVFEWLKESLQDYMIPDLILRVDKIDLNENGKIDRNKLKERVRQL